MNKDNRSEKQNCWTPGQILTLRDRELLEPLLIKAAELGYTPTQLEVPQARRIKRRFLTWGNAVNAAGLPWVNTPEQQKLRAQARRERRKSERVSQQEKEGERVHDEEKSTTSSI